MSTDVKRAPGREVHDGTSELEPTPSQTANTRGPYEPDSHARGDGITTRAICEPVHIDDVLDTSTSVLPSATWRLTRSTCR